MKHRAGSTQRWIATGLLLLFFFQLLSAATKLSATIDEGFHITSGYEYLRTGQMRLFDEHAPLAKALFAWPLFFVNDLQPPEKAAGWSEGNLIQVAQTTTLAYQPIDRVIVACRIPVILLTILLAATVYYWAKRLFGHTAGLFVLALFILDPNILAHGSLATTDMGAISFIFWTLLAFSSYLRNPDKLHLSIAALFLGLAQGAKLTALLLFPVLGLLIGIAAWQHPKDQRGKFLLRKIQAYALIILIACLVLWALYSFEIRTLPEVWNRHLYLPAASHIERWLRLQENLTYGREAFLLGQNQMHGWWQYFPIAFMLKTPIPTLLLGFSGIVAFLSSHKHTLNTKLAIIIFPFLYAASSLTSTINIGYRHLLPIFPFLYISIGSLWKTKTSNLNQSHAASKIRTRRPVVLCILLLWQASSTLRINPNYLAFFNEIARGPDNGWQYLADSNTDWGQSLKTLADYQKEHDLTSIKLSLFTFLDPQIYNVDYDPIAPMHRAPPVLPQRFNPEAGTYAISATTLDGVPLPYPATYDWFRHRPPLTKIGHVMFLYNVKPQQGHWIAQCTQPAPALSQKVISEGFGTENLREITFDCEQSWIIPDGGETLGWYTLAIPEQNKLQWPRQSEHLEWWPTWLKDVVSDNLKLSYVQPTPGERPPFAIWESKNWTAVTHEGTATLGGKIAFAGFTTPSEAKPGERIDVLTYWYVLEPLEAPISLMLHLTQSLGEPPLAVGDSLGISFEQWRTGDIIIQRHSIKIPEETVPGTYIIRTGIYEIEGTKKLEISGAEASLTTSLRIQ